MPLYEYECDVCGVRFERRQAVTDAPLMICPECGGRVRRLIQPAGVIFKTDSKKVRSSTVTPKGRAGRKRPARAK